MRVLKYIFKIKEEIFMKRKLALLLVCVLLTGLFGACGQKNTDDSESPTLTWYLPGTKPADNELVME